MLLCWQIAVYMKNYLSASTEKERWGKLKGGLYLEHLIEVLTEVLDEVHVREARQHQVSGLLGEGHLSLREPSPVERVWWREHNNKVWKKFSEMLFTCHYSHSLVFAQVSTTLSAVLYFSLFSFLSNVHHFCQDTQEVTNFLLKDWK